MPNPQEIFTVVAETCRQVGITVETVPRPWNGGYKDDVQKLGKHDLHLLGWTGDYNDAGNFVGTFFGRGKAEFGFNEPGAVRRDRPRPTARSTRPAHARRLPAGQPGPR